MSRRAKFVLYVALGIAALTASFVVAGFALFRERKEPHVGDIRKVAKLTLRGLNDYYKANREYPPFLVGGGHTVHWPGYAIRYNPYDEINDFEEVDTPGDPNPDPLIAGGHLHSYPLGIFLPEMLVDVVVPLFYEPRGYVRWRCMVSTPGDPLEAMWQDTIAEMPTKVRALIVDIPPLQGLVIDRAKESKLRKSKINEAIELYLTSLKRILALGGRKKERNGESYCFYDDGITGVSSHMTYFGYQRGEWLGKGKTEAWLWFYGNNAWYEENNRELREGDIIGPLAQETFLFCEKPVQGEKPLQGLDLLNAETGELVPDGIPDGICILYELRDGEVVKVTRAEDM